MRPPDAIPRQEPERPLLAAKELKRAIRRHRWDFALRTACESLQKGSEIPSETIEPLLTILAHPSDRRWNEKLIAAEGIRFATLIPGQATRAEAHLAAIFADTQVRAVERAKTYSAGIVRRSAMCLSASLLFACAAGLFYWLGGLAADLLHTRPHLYSDFWDGGHPVTVALAFLLASTTAAAVASLSFALITPVWSPWIDKWLRHRVRYTAAETLGKIGGVHSVGVLARAACRPGDYGMWRHAQAVLPRCLDRLSDADYGKANTETQGHLCDLLNSATKDHLPSEVTCKLFLAIEKVGGGPGVPTLEQIATRSPREDWRAEAARILPVLLERQRREQESARLLRATESPQAPESLLRPAAATAQSEELLLRAAPDDPTT